MALTNLTSLTQAQYHALTITTFPIAPSRSSTGSPDSRVSIQLAGWVGTSVLAFTITNQANSTAGLGISTSATNTLVANIAAGSNPAAVITYWTVDMGTNASGGNWQLNLQVDDGNADTGTWTFTKGKGDGHGHGHSHK